MMIFEREINGKSTYVAVTDGVYQIVGEWDYALPKKDDLILIGGNKVMLACLIREKASSPPDVQPLVPSSKPVSRGTSSP
jgi:hypothetical protein